MKHERILQHPHELLDSIARGVSCLSGKCSVDCIEVVFIVGEGEQKEEYAFGLAQALDAIANDLHWNEQGDWSAAKTALVRSM